MPGYLKSDSFWRNWRRLFLKFFGFYLLSSFHYCTTFVCFFFYHGNCHTSFWSVAQFKSTGKKFRVQTSFDINLWRAVFHAILVLTVGGATVWRNFEILILALTIAWNLDTNPEFNLFYRKSLIEMVVEGPSDFKPAAQQWNTQNSTIVRERGNITNCRCKEKIVRKKWDAFPGEENEHLIVRRIPGNARSSFC